MVKKKRTPTRKQLIALAKGRERLFQNQLKKMGLNLNPKPQIIREIIRQPINQVTTHQHNLNFQLSLFNKLLETKLFTLKVNKNKEKLNFYEIINRVYSQLNYQQNEIFLNRKKINKIINFVNSESKRYYDRFQKIEERILKLEKENNELKEKIKELEENETKNQIQEN